MRLPGSLLFVATLLVAGVRGDCDEDNLAYSTNDVERQKYNAGRTIRLGWVTFEGYAPLDLWGPLQILTGVSAKYNMTLSIVSDKKGPVSNRNAPHKDKDGHMMDMGRTLVSHMVATHTPADAPEFDLLMIPGGLGNRGNSTDWIVDFVKKRFNSTDYVASVCTGALPLAKAGVLDGKRATTNKWAWKDVVVHGKNVDWVPNARWTHDGKIWTSSGVAAGMDMTYALLSWMYGSKEVNSTMNVIELSPHTNADWDPYAVVHNVPGADKTRSLQDLVGPAGYA